MENRVTARPRRAIRVFIMGLRKGLGSDGAPTGPTRPMQARGRPAGAPLPGRLSSFEMFLDDLFPALLDLRGEPHLIVQQSPVRTEDERRGDSERGHLAGILRGRVIDGGGK